MTAATAGGPLAGIRILEVSHILAAPYCGMLLADLGAEVIKIEPPRGEMARTISPHHVGRYNVYFASLNRGKKSVVLDLAMAEGRRAFEGLAAGAQALLTNLRPGTIKALGLTYEALKSINPRLVCVALTGYGLDGPYADRPAFDYVIQALAGVCWITGDPGAPPTRAGWSAVDNSAGLTAAVGLLAKIVEGKGGQVDAALYDVMLSQLNYMAAIQMNAGEAPPRHKLGAHGYIVPAQMFETKDGYLMLFAANDKAWAALAHELGRPEWVSDPAFATAQARSANREAVVAAVAGIMMTDGTASWVERLSRRDQVVAGVETLEQALESDLTGSRNLVVALETPDGPIRVIASPIKFSDHGGKYGPPPLLGEHTAAYLGADADAVADKGGRETWITRPR